MGLEFVFYLTLAFLRQVSAILEIIFVSTYTLRAIADQRFRSGLSYPFTAVVHFSAAAWIAEIEETGSFFTKKKTTSSSVQFTNCQPLKNLRHRKSLQIYFAYKEVQRQIVGRNKKNETDRTYI